jgi:proteasome assembly chaperone (PAC2) family protein
MGHVGVNAGIYLLSKLEMTAFAEFDPTSLFDLEAVEVKAGIIRPARRPQSRLFLWTDPEKKNDLLVFIGEAQPPLGKYAFCRQLITMARGLGVERVFTFAAMATQMHPEHPSRVFAAATNQDTLHEMKQLELEVLEDGQIGGLNGVLLGVAAEEGLSGACLLGEMPHIFSQLAFPKASLAVLEVFSVISGIEIDLDQLSEQAEAVNEQLGELLARVEDQLRGQGEEPEEEGDEEYAQEPIVEEKKQDPEAIRRIEQLFGQASNDRSKAFELKQELDRLGIFKDYEDRFLDLFRKSDEPK